MHPSTSGRERKSRSSAMIVILMRAQRAEDLLVSRLGQKQVLRLLRSHQDDSQPLARCGERGILQQG